MAKLMMKGNEAMALAALKGGCKAFFGYPITPQSELPEYLSRYMRDMVEFSYKRNQKLHD